MKLGLRTKLIIAFLVVVLIPILFFSLYMLATFMLLGANNQLLEDDSLREEVITQVQENYSKLPNADAFYSEIQPVLRQYDAEFQIFDRENHLIFDSQMFKPSVTFEGREAPRYLEEQNNLTDGRTGEEVKVVKSVRSVEGEERNNSETSIKGGESVKSGDGVGSAESIESVGSVEGEGRNNSETSIKGGESVNSEDESAESVESMESIERNNGETSIKDRESVKSGEIVKSGKSVKGDDSDKSDKLEENGENAGPLPLTRLNIYAREGNDDISYLGPIRQNGTTVGYISLVINRQEAFNQLQQRVLRYILIGIAVTVTLLAGLIYLFTRGISREILLPLRELNQATEEIAQGHLDRQIRYHQPNELGQFSQAFETMRIKLKESLEKQAAYEENRKELIASISHDLRTPIASIKGYVEGLQDGIAKDPERVARYLKVIQTKTDQLDALIDDLFQFSQLELEKLSLHRKQCQSRQMLEEILRPFEEEFATDSEINFHLVRPLPDVSVLADPMRISQVLSNLISNARQYVDSTDGTIKVAAEIWQDALRVSVQDNGAGIVPADLPHVFEKFYRGEKSRSREYGGIGLGLAICKEIIREHGGEIWAQSLQGRGTTFYLTIPTN